MADEGGPVEEFLQRAKAELDDVEVSLRRLEEGTYGTCEICGCAIPASRLEELPMTRTCGEHRL